MELGPRVTAVEPLEPYRVRLTFTNGAYGTVDLAPSVVGQGGMFGPLNHPDFFRQVRLEPLFGSIEWPNGVDLCPDVLYSRLQREGWVLPKARQPYVPTTGGPPEVSRFYDIVVSMDANNQPEPHFHVRYGSQEALVQIAPVRILRGALSPRVMAFVGEWAACHTAELTENWNCLQANEPMRRIPPLE